MKGKVEESADAGRIQRAAAPALARIQLVRPRSIIGAPPPSTSFSVLPWIPATPQIPSVLARLSVVSAKPLRAAVPCSGTRIGEGKVTDDRAGGDVATPVRGGSGRRGSLIGRDGFHRA